MTDNKTKCGFCGREFPIRAKPTRQSFCDKGCYAAWLYAYNKTDNPTNKAEFWTQERKAAARLSGQQRRGECKGYKKFHRRHEHRVVAERMLGRPLANGEVVHHRNGDTTDNRPENLEVMTKAAHARLHAIANGLGTRIRGKRRKKGGDAY